MSFVTELEPRPVWKHFDEILAIPRASKDEERMRAYVISVAERNGLEHEVDATGNVVVRKPAASGREKAPVVVLQSHLDMVQEKNSDVQFDFGRDAIRPRRDGEYLKATGTTLGSDNGIGVAAMLALMDAKDVTHGPLEFLFTVDEETGLTGAGGLRGDLLRGRTLINLDSEEEGVLTIGCAGGADSHLTLALGKEANPSGATAFSVKLSGLLGGHSGVDIHRQRGNAVKLLGRALHAARLRHEFRLADLAGGNAHNAIPREAHALVVATGEAAEIRAAIEHEFDVMRQELGAVEPDLRFELQDQGVPARVWDAASTRRVLQLVDALPHGVAAMSHDMPGLVETSTNLAVVGEKDGAFRIWMSTRSSVGSALRALRQRIRATAALAGADVREDGGYPGWKPNVSSELLAVVKRVHERVVGREAEIGAVHAGLECGIIGEKCPGMDMISFGPQIEFPHSPDERVKIGSVATFYRLLTATLAELR